jgi:hypothetical protein
MWTSPDDTGESSGEEEGYGAISRNVMEGISIQPSMGPSGAEHFSLLPPREAWEDGRS